MGNTISIQVGNKRRDVIAPESWDALDLRTLIMFYETLFVNKGDEFTASLFTSVKLISMTKFLLKLTDAEMAKWEADCFAEDSEHGAEVFAGELRAVIQCALEGLFTISDDEKTGATLYSCRLNRTKNPYPKLAHTPKGRGKAKKTTWLYCADDGLANLSIYEMATCFTLYENHLNTGDEAWANQLIGTLYRPTKPPTRHNVESAYEGDRRQPLRRYEAKVAERAEMATTMPTQVRRLLLFWFASCRQQIVEAYPKVFRRSKGSEAAGYGWGGVLLAIAGGPAGLDQIADQHHGNALTWLSMQADEREEAERRAEEMKRKRR